MNVTKEDLHNVQTIKSKDEILLRLNQEAIYHPTDKQLRPEVSIRH